VIDSISTLVILKAMTRIYWVILLSALLSACSTFVSSEDREMAREHLQVGTTQLQSGNYPQALSTLLTAEKLDPENAVIQNYLGLAYLMRDRADLGEIHVRKALAIQSNYTDARNNLSSILNERSKYQESIVEAKIVIQDLTYNAPEKPYINLGTAQFKLGQYKEARESFLKAIEYQRDNCLANSYYGRSLFELKDYKKAADALDRAVGFCKRSQFDEPHYYSALTYFELGQKDKSEARFEEMIRIYPNGEYIDKAKNMLETIRR